jgi:hypothetical protein
VGEACLLGQRIVQVSPLVQGVSIASVRPLAELTGLTALSQPAGSQSWAMSSSASASGRIVSPVTPRLISGRPPLTVLREL